jgi:hypothetical protein
MLQHFSASGLLNDHSLHCAGNVCHSRCSKLAKSGRANVSGAGSDGPVDCKFVVAHECWGVIYVPKG